MKVYINGNNTNNSIWLTKENEYDGFDGNGSNMPPSISWTDSPVETKSFALTLYDPDATTGSGFWHWILINIPSSTKEITLDNYNEFESVMNDFGDKFYSGACPPLGDKAHQYIFTIHALNVENIEVNKETTNAIIRFLINNHTIEKTTISTYYKR